MLSLKQQTILGLALALILAVSLITSLFFKESWLWMDEVLSYLFLSDTSVSHMNDAIVSGMDANPPLFENVYWWIGHTVSLNPQFLRAVSVCLFAIAIALLYVYTTSLVGTPVTNFVLITVIVGFTYLNFTLATQIRGYSLYLLISLGFFVACSTLITSPNRLILLAGHCVTGILLAFIHNFGLFYVVASGIFFAALFVWSRQRSYLTVLASYGVVGLVWLLVWFPNFVIQAQAGKPHSWIPLPTFWSFFSTLGELAPTVSSALERQPLFSFIPILRFILIVGLFLYIAIPRLKRGFRAVRDDRAFLTYLFAGSVYFITIGMALVLSFGYTSIFISRYFWPGHLLLIYQLVYAWYVLRARLTVPIHLPGWTYRLLPVYCLVLMGFIFYQNRKIVIFPSGVVSFLGQLDNRYPVFVETADYFLPIWFHNKDIDVRYLLDWQTAAKADNILSATVEHKILKSVREKYHLTGILPVQRFNPATVPHFYVVDESSHYQIEHFIQMGRVQVVRELPIDIKGHRLLECMLKS